MEQKGGHFVRALAECFKRADPKNTAILVRAFPTYIETYRNLCIEEMETAEREKAGD